MAKRFFDIVLSTLTLIVLSPLFLVVIVVLRITGEGQVLYRQERTGQGGRPFVIFKFATMLKNSAILPGGDITVKDDERVLPVGRFLRHTKINELPQLLNVLLGDISLIGPRPLTPRLALFFPASHWDCRPGLSGLASIAFRDEEKLLSNVSDSHRVYAEVIAPYKADLERWYAHNHSFWLDLQLIALTVLAVVKPRSDVLRFFEGLPDPPSGLLTLRDRKLEERERKEVVPSRPR